MSLFAPSFSRLLLCLSLLTSTTSVAAAPNTHPPSRIHASPHTHSQTGNTPNIHGIVSNIANGIDLRILPIGASMVIGHGSSDLNSFREKLRDLIGTGNNVEYIGSQNRGNMSNNACECHSGFPIGPLAIMAAPTLRQLPNVILLLAGTNDLLHDMNVKEAPLVMGNLVDNLTDTLPEATLVVATVPPFSNPYIDYKRPPFNTALGPVIEERQKQGKRVLLVDPAVPIELIQPDQIHPNDVGYQMYADKFYLALVQAGMKGWIKPLAEQAGIQDKLRDEYEVVQETTAAFAKKTHVNMSFIIGIAVFLSLYWVARKALLSTRVRLRLRSPDGRLGL